MPQKILSEEGSYEAIRNYFKESGLKRVLLVHGKSFERQALYRYFLRLKESGVVKWSSFTDFTPNPEYGSVRKGVEAFHAGYCDGIVAVGGGSCIDVAKCIRLFQNMDSEKSYLEQEIHAEPMSFLAIPTTAGTGSEATSFAVIYDKGKKISIADTAGIPDAVYFDAAMLKTLPDYQRKATMLDALCHGIESYWSVHSNEESRNYAAESIRMVLQNKDGYLANEEEANRNMFIAANLAGKAINITKTTAGHAMCYKLTSRYGYAHGHAAALCNVWLWEYMEHHLFDCVDVRGKGYLQKIFEELAELLQCESVAKAVCFLKKLVEELALERTIAREDIDMLTDSVNVERLKNNPVGLSRLAIKEIYYAIYHWNRIGE